MKSWFESWFNTPYYHTLYKNRNQVEANDFMKRLAKRFSFNSDQYMLDLACGKGRHAIYLNSLGYRVDGADLSVESIASAMEMRNKRLHFYVHDMRDELPRSYDVILNLFTSFGYFEVESENVAVLTAIKKSLTADGLCIIDFLNLDFVKKHMIPYEVKSIDGIDFHISKKISNTHILKNIEFEADGEKHQYQEKVQALSFNHFQQLADKAGLKIQYAYGDYELQSYLPSQSDRLILALTHK
jgi:SAM-dependent methyltransferase